jgi:hypothetical protein
MTEAVNGMFDPQNAEETMDGLITVIKVSNSLLGMEAISEEFAHLMVEGLQHKEHVKRLLNIIRNDDNLMKSILGEEYD